MARVLLISMVLLLSAPTVHAQILYTVAGTGTAGSNGDGGPALQAELNGPQDVIFDSVGNLYIADAKNHRVRRVDAATGTITTVVGTGVPGYNGDGTGAATQLNTPRGLGMTNLGLLIITDSVNQCVRTWDPTNDMVTTIAGTCNSAGFSGDGGPATSARLAAPNDAAGGPNGQVYIADTGNGRVRWMTLGGNINTLAGNPMAFTQCTQNLPMGTPANAVKMTPVRVGVDAWNKVYIAPDLCSAVITVSGSGGTALSVEPGTTLGIMLDALPVPGGGLFVSSLALAGRIWRVKSGAASAYAGNGQSGFSPDGTPAVSAKLDYGTPSGGGVALGPNGTVCFAETGNNRVRCVGATPPDSLGCLQIPCAGTHWVALPTTTPLVNETDLCNAIPGASTVTQWFPKDNANFGSYTWDCTNQTCAPASGGGACGSPCFCIDDGEGYSVTTSGPALVPLMGHDDPVSITLPAGGRDYLISPPIESNLNTALDLANVLALPASTTITERNGCTGTTNAYLTGSIGAFSLVKGRALLLHLPGTGGFTYVNPTGGGGSGQSCALSQGNEYCISGKSSGGDYSWGMDLDGTGAVDNLDPSVSGVTGIPAGFGSDALAYAFAASINLNQNSVVASYPGTAPNCFKLSATIPLYVGPASGPPTCLVGPNGCAYNPIITLGPGTVGTEIPTLGTLGLGILLIGILGVGCVLLLRGAA